MSRIKQISLACSLAAAALLTGQAVYAADGAPPMAAHGSWHRQDHRGGHGGSWLRRVHLTEAQRDQVFQLRYAQEPAMHDKYKALRHMREDLRKLTLSDQYDGARVTKLASDEAQTRASLTVLRAELSHKIYMLLTPEQKKQLAQRGRMTAKG